MNVLPVILSILMLMSIMTYAKLQSFLTSSALRIEYVCFMKVASRSLFNEAEKKRYDAHHVESDKDKPKALPVNATSKINLSLFGSEEFRQKHYSSVPTYQNILRRLIQILYSNKDFYKEIEEERPDFLNELINAVEDEMLALDQAKNTLKKAEELSYLELGDEKLQSVFNKMLREPIDMDIVYKICKEQISSDKSIRTVSLANFVEFNQTSLKPFRVFLASRPVLLAIYQDEPLVDEIIAERKWLFNELKSAPKNVREVERKRLSEEFQALFGNRAPLGITPDMLNFEVSLTKPKS